MPMPLSLNVMRLHPFLMPTRITISDQSDENAVLDCIEIKFLKISATAPAVVKEGNTFYVNTSDDLISALR